MALPASTATAVRPKKRLATWQLALLGGLLFIGHVLIFVGMGCATGQMPPDLPDTWMGRLDGAVFFSIYTAIGATLVRLAEQVGTWVRYPAALLASVGMACGLAGSMVMVLDLHVHVMQSLPLGPGILLLFVSALLVGGTGWANRRIGRPVCVGLMLFALSTVPLAMAFPMLEPWLPMYVLYDFHFLPVGLGWIALAWQLRREEILSASR
ncbi:hypothetical protein SAMN05421823_111190 [Catalinimonas alkaloidigena]|uniref:DUF998 domain-containing protein n=1 Tax=Catalinimonas alkaloidigena TaxID=1075417 RepID=A0A1G9RKZ9_9BACT|nr:hypothetical protein [Catalinimonas alkaloidigena]SDM23831.1 hypothetical protein SAMN05421823_111190 [Catalinimonas alkaloidigena]